MQSGSSTAALNTTSANKRSSIHGGKATSAVGNTGKVDAVRAGGAVGSGLVGKDVLSPGELCGFVDTLLSQLETRFDEMSNQVMTRMNDMSTRIDRLENTVQDLMNSDIDQPSSQTIKSPVQ